MRRAVLPIALILLAGACSPASETGFRRADRLELTDGSEAVDRGEAEVAEAVTISMGEFFFEPTVITAPAGSELRVTLDNAGENVHAFEIAAQGIDLTLAESTTEVVTVEVPDRGAITFGCKFHLPEAMRGEIRAG
jgi:plastocyanin